MLQAIISHKKTERPRLWFADADHDLFIWLDADAQPAGFQYCYNKRHGDEHMLQWFAESGYSHQRVDSGEAGGQRYKMTPVMLPDGEPDVAAMATEFLQISAGLDKSLAEFVYGKLRDFTV